jgi:phosphoglycolate phosphatase-like HAD superfamily hydrolase
MSDLARQLFGDDVPAKACAIIVDLDETICTQFDQPIVIGVQLLQRLDRQKLAVHYVTARTDVSRRGTEQFLEEHRLPGWRNVHYSPTIIGSCEHKRRKHAELAREFQVLASIGDSFEEEEASAACGITFVLVDTDRHELAWLRLEELLRAAIPDVFAN